jgi:hypothetical protein
MIDDYINELESELKAAAARKLRLATARVPRPRPGVGAVAVTIVVCVGVAVGVLQAHSRHVAPGTGNATVVNAYAAAPAALGSRDGRPPPRPRR